MLWAVGAGADVIIITDSFDISVKEVLEHNGLSEGVVSAIFAKRSHYTEQGELVIEGEMEGEGGRRRCSFSGRPRCKGDVLSAYSSGRDYDFVCYAGDGKNDLCACLRLDACRGDLAMPRKHWALAGLLQERQLPVSVVEWENGDQIREAIQSRLVV